MLSASVNPMKTAFLHVHGTVMGKVKSEQGTIPVRPHTKPILALVKVKLKEKRAHSIP